MTAATPRGLDPASLALIDAYLAELKLRGCTAMTLKNRRNSLHRLGRQLPCPLLDASPDVLLDWQHSHLTGLAASTRSSMTSLARVFYRWAVRRGHLAVDPTPDLVRPRVPRYLPRPIGEDDLREAIESAPERVRPWLVLAAYAGLRAAEIAALRREDVCDTVRPPVLIVRHGKGDRDRVVPLSPAVIDLLPGLPRRGWLFPRRDGTAGHVKPHTVSHLVARHLHELGLPSTCHALRHRFGSQVYALSGDIRVAQELLGHQRLETTAVYTAWHGQAAHEAVQQLT
jgi:integrase